MVGYLAFASRIVAVVEIVKSHSSYGRPISGKLLVHATHVVQVVLEYLTLVSDIRPGLISAVDSLETAGMAYGSVVSSMVVFRMIYT